MHITMHISEMSNLDMRSYMYNFPMNTHHTQSKHMSAIFIHEMKPAHTTELSWQTWHKRDGKSMDAIAAHKLSLDLISLYYSCRYNWWHTAVRHEQSFVNAYVTYAQTSLKFELTIVHSQWAGTHWTSQSMPSPLRRSTASLHDQRTPEEKKGTV